MLTPYLKLKLSLALCILANIAWSQTAPSSIGSCAVTGDCYATFSWTVDPDNATRANGLAMNASCNSNLTASLGYFGSDSNGPSFNGTLLEGDNQSTAQAGFGNNWLDTWTPTFSEALHNPIITLNDVDASSQVTINDCTGNAIPYNNLSAATIQLNGTYGCMQINVLNDLNNPDSYSISISTCLAQIPEAKITGNTALNCTNTSTTLSAVTSTTVGTASYKWTGGSTGPTLSVSTGGNYSLTVTDAANSRTDVTSVIVSQNTTNPNAMITGNAPLTCGTSSITLSATSSTSTGSKAYKWSDGSTGSTLNVSSADTYSVTVTDQSNGCTDNTSVVVTASGNNTEAVITGKETLTCRTTAMTLSGVTSSTSGTPSYMWTDGSTGSTLIVDEPGVYALTVTDQSTGCSNVAMVTVTQNIDVPTVSISGNQAITCSNTSVTLSASKSLNKVEIKDSYEWSTGASTTNITVTQAGPYSVTLTSADNGCTSSESVTVSGNTTNPIAIITGNETLTCSNSMVTLSAATSSPSSSKSYKWSNNTTNATLDVTAAGMYSVTVTDQANGCTDVASVIVSASSDKPMATITGNAALTCTNTTVTLSAATSTPTGNKSYKWSNNTTNATLDVTAAGMYSVTVTDQANGCTDVASVIVSASSDKPMATITGNAALTCTNTTVTLSAATSTPAGNKSYKWSNNSTNAILDVTAAGMYSVTVTDQANGCTDVASVIVSASSDKPMATITGNAALTCTNTTVTLSAATSTPTGNKSYKWSNNTTNAILDVTAAGMYSVTVTDQANGCTDVASVIVSASSDKPMATITGNAALTCTNTTVTLSAATSTPAGNKSYKWSNNSTNAILDVTAAGMYSVTVTDQANGCTDIASVTVAQNVLAPTFSIQKDGNLTCSNTDVQLSATIQVQGNPSYAWSDENSDELSTATTLIVTEPGNYYLVITDDANGCSSERVRTDVSLFNEKPEAIITGNEILTCATTEITLSAETSTSSGAKSYNWTGSKSSATLAVTEARTYSVTVTNQLNGCTDIESVTITANTDKPTAEITGNQILTCKNPTVTLSAESSSPAGSKMYSWTGGSTNMALDVTTPNTYNVTVTDPSNGCTDVETVTVSQNITQPTFSLSPIPLTCEIRTGTVGLGGININNIQPSSGIEVSYRPVIKAPSKNIDNFQVITVSKIDELLAGTYEVKVEILETGCSTIQSLTIDELPEECIAIPSMSQWGLFILGLLICNIGLIQLSRFKKLKQTFT